MNQETLREYCLTKKYTTEEFPFDNVTIVLKVGGKMFAVIPLDTEPRIALKCDPELAIELREQYSAVHPAHHFNKKHWNQIIMDDSVTEKQVKEWIDHSYSLVYNSLTGKTKENLNNL